jgi:chromosome segregation ATPase
MMPLSRRKRRQIQELYFEGHSMDSIRQYANVGKGSVEDTIARLKNGQYEEFANVLEIVDELREISVFVRKHMDGDLERCFIGSAVWVAINEMGLEPSQVKEWSQLCEDLSPPDMPKKEFVAAMIWCKRLEKELGVDIASLPGRIEALRGEVETLHGEIEALNAERDSLRSDVKALKSSTESLREEQGLVQDIKGIKEAQHEEESKLAEIEGGTRVALATANVTQETLERFRVFSGTASARNVPVDSKSMDTLISLIADLGPDGIDEVTKLSAQLAKERLKTSEAISLLTGLWRRGFTLRRATAVVHALGSRGSFSSSLNRMTSLLEQCETLDAAVATRAQQNEELRRKEAAIRGMILQLKQAEANLKSSVDDLSRLEREAGASIEKKLRESDASIVSRQQKADEQYLKKQHEADELYLKRQQEADGRLKTAEEMLRGIQENADRLGKRNRELSAINMTLNEQIRALKEETTESTRQRDDIKGQLQAALIVNGEWDAIQTRMRTLKEKHELELKELETQIAACRDTLALAEHLKRALGGDSPSARTVFSYYAVEPRTLPGRSEPLPDPEWARKKLVTTVLELVKNEAVPREEFERTKNKYEEEVSRLQNVSNEAAGTIEGLKAQMNELRDKLNTSEGEKRRLSSELHATEKNLEWSEQLRADLLAEQRKR